MLTSTFQHLRGITAERERALWQKGILTWDDLDRAHSRQPTLFGNTQAQSDGGYLWASRKALEARDSDFFAETLQRRDYFRIALAFPEDTLFLDIETTGLSKYYHEITLVGWSLGGKYGCFIRGTSPSSLLEYVERAKVLVTFNGTLFDLPFLRNEFPNLIFPKAHIDLRYFARHLGLSGGQKRIERQIGLRRAQELAEVGGEEAVFLWHQYRHGSLEALRKLIEYNQADVQGMCFILDTLIDRIAHSEFPPDLPVRPHRFYNELSSSTNGLAWRPGATKGIHVRPYSGKTGPLISYSQLATFPAPEEFKVVGIDLTGSEQRPSGWCLLKGYSAITRRLETDEEIFSETLQAKPALVSIDSPLSLPAGRQSVGDDDPTREKFGILRQCERELKRRGVNVYPSLIPSMQRLTARGIRLAQLFRESGIPVIESYPGAAQDILSIPRKRHSLEYLKKGLIDFGVEGEFESREVSHDELDAITSALVAVFFWAGRFEALGNDEEEFLIVPDLRVASRWQAGRVVLGLSGPIASGKTTAGKYLQSKGLCYCRFSMILEEMLAERGGSITREGLQALGESVHKKPGQRWLCRKLAARIGSANRVVIDGLRHPEDHAFLLEEYGPAFTHATIHSSERIRRDRYTRQSGTAEDFTRAVTHPVESHVVQIARLASRRVTNNGSRKSFYASLDTLLTSLGLDIEENSQCQ